MVMDLGSRNGTYVNGRLLRPHEEHVLAHGDELVLGTLHVILFFQQAWAAST
jgi:pSer/pThr/pTyr-binding forkhead associated (FHA) protein